MSISPTSLTRSVPVQMQEPSAPPTSAPSESWLLKFTTRFRRMIVVATTAVALMVISLIAAPAASAGVYTQTWGPNQSYITLDVNGSGTWVNGATAGNWAWGPSSATICNYQFAVTYYVGNWSPRTVYGTRGGCVNGYAGAWTQFKISQHLTNGSSICGHMWRDGQYYRGPCATIRA